MNSRERFLNSMDFKSVDKPLYWEIHGFLDRGSGYGTKTGSTVDRWKDEGLSLLPEQSIREYFGFDRFCDSIDPCWDGLQPLYEEVTVEDTPEYRIWRDTNGVLMKRLKMVMCMPQYLEFPVKNRQTWLEYRRRLEESYKYAKLNKQKWLAVKNGLQNRDYPVGIWFPGMYGHLSNIIGPENLAFMYYDDPALVCEIMDYVLDAWFVKFDHVLNEIDLDFALGSEDVAYKTGLLISPATIREFLFPRYRKIVPKLREKGVKHIFVDSDGKIDELIPLLLEVGVNGVFPLEVNAGMDPVAVRKQYGRDLLLIGGIDKMPLIKNDKELIKEEVTKKLPFLYSQGGYIGSLDHGVPPDVSFESYSFYIEQLKKILGQ